MPSEEQAVMKHQSRSRQRISSDQSARKEKQVDGLERPDEASEMGCVHCPDESKKSSLKPPKSSETGGGRSRAFNPSMIGLQTSVVGRTEVGKLNPHRQSMIPSRIFQINSYSYFDCPHLFPTMNGAGGDIVPQTKIRSQDFATAARFTAQFSGSTFDDPTNDHFKCHRLCGRHAGSKPRRIKFECLSNNFGSPHNN
jgi:hypothetical protein